MGEDEQTLCCVLGGDERKSIYGRTPIGVGGPKDFTWSNQCQHPNNYESIDNLYGSTNNIDIDNLYGSINIECQHPMPSSNDIDIDTSIKVIDTSIIVWMSALG